MTNWIKTSERVPENANTVIAYWRYPIDYREYEGAMFYDGVWWDREGRRITPPDYWAVPDPPKEEA